MIQPTNKHVDKNLLDEIAKIDTDGKLSLNTPTGDFFYDPWLLKEEYKNTAIEKALNELPGPIGEARLINLESGRCYFSHSDIDDRYHLNITGDCAALINLETEQTWFLTNDGVWYDMDAGPLHSAVNFGQYNRKQLVVRKLLIRTTLKEPVQIQITAKGENPRFLFDNTVSPWLNRANKKKIIADFKPNNLSVSFKIEKSFIQDLKELLPEHFEIIETDQELV
jgi:hypothetical protein